MHDLVIGGAGLFGLTIAEQAASHGYKVLIIEKQNKIGGNVSSHFDEETGVEIHTHGSHIFHTSNEKVWEYVNRFSSWVPYIHRVRSTIADGRVIPLPFGLATYSAYYKKAFTPQTMRDLIATFPEQNQQTFEGVAISSIGEDIYRAVVEGYTRKQWGKDPNDLPSSVIKRLPVRFTWDDGYFNDTYQGLPQDGYQAWMERMADHKNIEITFNSTVPHNSSHTPLVFTGAIDAFFNFKHGHLSWRSVEFEQERPNMDDYQGCSVMNYGDATVPWTRIHEYKHYRPDRSYRGTVIHKEFSRETAPFETGAYPVNTAEDKETLKKYREEAGQLKGVWLGGRLGSYKYIDMHAAIASALVLWNNDIQPYLEAS